MELSISKLSKHYGSKIAVDEFEAAVGCGIHALLGANGSGKTTLMRMLCGILRPTSGSISLDGTDIYAMGEHYRELLGYLPQNFGYYPNFSGWDFMIYLAALKGLPKIAAVNRSEELLQMVGLYDARKKKLKTYSGGMRQRIGIAQALLNDPAILILDEPTAGLDPKERTKFRNIISDLSANRIILLSTHIVSDVEYVAGDIIIMKQGRLALRNSSEYICSAIQNSVWTATVPPADAQKLMRKHTVSNLRHAGEQVELRIISDEKPYGGAIQSPPNLEDLYLYFFREDNINELDEA
ncbi:MAG: ABC transporter ATP-binding protein [Eubacteriaceae bacterium]|nr:ABC transporter ATP-binding protein [Eubacteriaceae bacterium]